MSNLVIIINPPIYDFAAYDLFIKPMGLLYLAAFLRRAGYEVRFIDALDRHHPAMVRRFGPPIIKPNGTGKYHAETIEKPSCLRHVPRFYRRFGMPEEVIRECLEKAAGDQSPAAVLLGSMMTYWYPGVVHTISLVREIFPHVPVGLSGVYTRLMPEHARRVCRPDMIFIDGRFITALRWLDILVGRERDYSRLNDDFPSWPLPAYDLYDKLDYLTLVTSLGCPYHCQYCASRDLQPHLEQLTPMAFIDQFQTLLPLLEKHLRDRTDAPRHIAFIDDALLANVDRHITPILEQISRFAKPFHFYTPNGLHCRFVTRQVAKLMFNVGFKMIRLSYEASDESGRWQQASDNKVHDREFHRAVKNLIAAGFPPRQLEVYILTGLPGQTMREIEDSAAAVHRAGLKIRLCQYTPIPGTPLFNLSCSRYGIDPDEPLMHNNSILPVLVKDNACQAFQDFKNRVNLMNQKISQ